FFQLLVLESHTLGSHGFRTRDGAFRLRGNLFIRIGHSSLPTAGKFVNGLVANLDAHFSRENPGTRLPAIEIIDTEAILTTVKRGETSRVTELRQMIDLLAATTSVSDVLDVLVPLGPPDEDGQFVFYPQAPGTTRVAAEKRILRH